MQTWSDSRPQLLGHGLQQGAFPQLQLQRGSEWIIKRPMTELLTTQYSCETAARVCGGGIQEHIGSLVEMLADMKRLV